jgi:hypothetical protein
MHHIVALFAICSGIRENSDHLCPRSEAPQRNALPKRLRLGRTLSPLRQRDSRFVVEEKPREGIHCQSLGFAGLASEPQVTTKDTKHTKEKDAKKESEPQMNTDAHRWSYPPDPPEFAGALKRAPRRVVQRIELSLRPSAFSAVVSGPFFGNFVGLTPIGMIRARF